MKPKDQVIEVWGELACFTRPELKVERFSYPVITPSAARGIFDAIYCKPAEFRWQITAIEVLSPPSYIALRRNEVKEKANVNAILKWMEGLAEPEPIWADGDRDLSGSDEKGRTQRQTMALRDVRYRLHAKICPWSGFEERIQGFENQFRRRAASGKCIYQPCLGCREFPAYFELVETGADPAVRVPWDADLGLMLYDVFDLSTQGSSTAPARVSLFHGEVLAGLLRVPPYESDEVLKSPAGRLVC